MRLLLALDAPDSSDTATWTITSRPWPGGTIVRVVSVVRHVRAPPPPPPPWSLGSGRTAMDVESALALFATTVVEGVAVTLQRAGLSTQSAVLRGNPGPEIVAEASRWSADLVVIAANAFTGVTRWLPRSVVRYIVKHAQCSVEVVRGTHTAGSDALTCSETTCRCERLKELS